MAAHAKYMDRPGSRISRAYRLARLSAPLSSLAGGGFGSATVVAKDGLPYLATAPGRASYAAKPELGAREGCSRAYRPKAKHAPTAQ